MVWYISFDDGDTISESWLFNSLVVNNNLELYAAWMPNTYTCSLDENFGVGLGLETYDILYGFEYVIPIVYREGYTFVGWVDSQTGILLTDEIGILFNPYNKIGTTEFVAVWEETMYSIAFNNIDGANTFNCMDEYSLASIDTEIGTPTKAGYVFTGWNIFEEYFGREYIKFQI